MTCENMSMLFEQSPVSDLPAGVCRMAFAISKNALEEVSCVLHQHCNIYSSCSTSCVGNAAAKQ